MQQHPAAVLLDSFGVASGFKIYGNWVHPMHLLVGVASSVSYRYDEHKQVRALFGNFRKYLDEVKCPIFPGVLLGIGKSVEPGLEFVEQQHDGGML